MKNAQVHLQLGLLHVNYQETNVHVMYLFIDFYSWNFHLIFVLLGSTNLALQHCPTQDYHGPIGISMLLSNCWLLIDFHEGNTCLT